MGNMSLDQWGVITPTNEMKKPLIVSDAHADYLVETFCPDVLLAKQINAYLEEEKIEEKRVMEAHSKYAEKNYIRVGESNGKN